MRALLKLLLTGLSIAWFSPLFSQVSYIPFSEDYYHIVDRYAILNTDSNAFCTSIKPFNRDIVPAWTTSLEEHSQQDRFNRQLVLSDNWDVFPDTEQTNIRLLGKRPLWKYFYRHRGSFFSVDKPDFRLVVNPVLGASLGKSNSDDIFRNTRGAELRGSIGNKVGFYSFLSENQFRYPDYYTEQIKETNVIPGTGFIKTFGSGGYDFLIARGYITFQANDYIKVQFGHDKNFIGNGYRSLIISDFAKENLFLKLHTKIWRFNYINLFSELTDFQNRGINGQRKKYSALHYLNFNIVPGKLDVGLFENIVFARNDSTQQPGFEFNYLNPIIFYRAVEHGLNSSDNSLLGMDVKWNFFKGMQFYGQFILDEFHKNELFNRTGSWVNKWAYQAGFKYLNVANLPNLDLQIETNVVRPYVYTHFKTDQTWTHFDQAMAHPIGANFTEYLAVVRYQLFPRFNVVAKYFDITHGADSSLDHNTTHYGGNILTHYLNRPQDDNLSIGQGLSEKIRILDVKLSYQIYNRTFIDLRVVRRNADRETPLNSFSNNIILVGLRMNTAAQRLDF